MAWPKGLSRNNREQKIDLTKIQASQGQVVARGNVSDPTIKKSFDTGKWYKYTGDRGIILDDSGRVCKWSVIKFEVVKIAYGIAAVRFEDGSFEAITGASLEDFEEVSAPKY